MIKKAFGLIFGMGLLASLVACGPSEAPAPESPAASPESPAASPSP